MRFFILALAFFVHLTYMHAQSQVTIGSQTWMHENLVVERFNNGDLIPEAKTASEWERAGLEKRPAWCYPNNDINLGRTNGKLYNWYAVSDSRGIAPVGWRVPTLDDFNKLVIFLGEGTSMKDADEELAFKKILTQNRIDQAKLEHEKSIKNYPAEVEKAKKLNLPAPIPYEQDPGWPERVSGFDAIYEFYSRGSGGKFENYAPGFWSQSDGIETLKEVMGFNKSKGMYIYESYFEGHPELGAAALELDGDADLYGEYKSNGYSVRCIQSSENTSSNRSQSTFRSNQEVQTISMDRSDRSTNSQEESPSKLVVASPTQQFSEGIKNKEVVVEEDNTYTKAKVSNRDQKAIVVLKAVNRNSENQAPTFLSVYDENTSLKVGDNVLITKQEVIQVPGQKKKISQQNVLGNAIVVEEFNKPIYLLKLNEATSFKMKDYKDGSEDYFAVKTKSNQTKISAPRIMVVPKKVKQELFNDGEYDLKLHEKVLISSLKNKLEDNGFTTIGFESAIKKVMEDRMLNSGTKTDLKSLILESSGADFYVEFEIISTDGGQCNKVVDFKIRNYANSEDIASDIKSLDACGSPEQYKQLASDILSKGANAKINNQFKALVENGRKVAVNFTIENTSSLKFNKSLNGSRLEEHIEKCIQNFAFNGNYLPGGAVANRMSFLEVSIPFVDNKTGQNYSPNAFSLDIIKYLKENAGIECEKSVVGGNINITVK